MPSPFPGMDPYLEHPAHWPDVHHETISVTREMLNRQLRPRYVCRIEERVYLSNEFDLGSEMVIPDVRIAATTLFEMEVHEARIEIRDAERKTVVTVIEVLSPSNKVPGSAGMNSYREQRQEIMESTTRLVEIDLLRKGSRFRVPSEIPHRDYRVHVSRSERRPPVSFGRSSSPSVCPSSPSHSAGRTRTLH